MEDLALEERTRRKALSRERLIAGAAMAISQSLAELESAAVYKYKPFRKKNHDTFK